MTLPEPSTRPVAPVLEGLTPAQKRAGRHLKMIHDYQRNNMGVLQELLASARAGGLPESGAEAALHDVGWLENLRRFGTLCGEHCKIVNIHHTLEDRAVFPQLSERATAFRSVIRRLEEEHVAVHALLVRLIGELNDLNAQPSAENFERAEASTLELEAFLLSHFGYEEESIGDALGYFGVEI